MSLQNSRTVEVEFRIVLKVSLLKFFFIHSVLLLFKLKDLHLTGPHVHHLLQPVQGQPTSLASYVQSAHMVHIFFSDRSTAVMHILRSWAYTTVIVYMLCQLLPCISNYYCGILDGKCPSQVSDHHLVIFSFLNNPVEYFTSWYALKHHSFWAALKMEVESSSETSVTTHQSTPLWEPQVLHLKYHF